ncbi:unnamed protein product [Absidia cylindrospora]
MNNTSKAHLLSLNQPTINTNGLEQLVSMWSVLSKCKNHLEQGTRLENMSWRLWHQKHQHQQPFVKPILSLSAGNPLHEVSQTKQTQKNHVPDKDDWSYSLITVTSSASSPLQQPKEKKITTKAEAAGSTNALVPSTATAPNTNNSRTTTPSLSSSYQYEDGENDDDDDYDDDFYDDDYDDDIYDDDDLYDDNDNYIYDEAEEAFMHNYRAEKLRTYRSSQHYFEKTSPQPLTQQPSLLSALFKTSSSSSSIISPPSSSRNTLPATTTSTTNAPPDQFLKKELTESLRDNVLWEHVQQKPLYTTNTATSTRSHPSYYHHSPPSYTYQSPFHHSHNNRPPLKKIVAPSDQGWLESFHGW